MNSETESSTAKNNNDDGSLYVPYKNKLKSAVVLICLLMVSIGILSRDRAFFEEFLEHPQTVVEETATGKGSGIASCSNSSQNAIDTRSSASFFSSMNKTDWFHDDLWSTKNHCFEVDHVCFSTARWWYNTNVPGKQDLRQPNFTYTAHSDHASTRAKLALPKQIEVRPATKLVENMTCPYSPFPNHLLLTSVFNDMLGEFYARMLVGLIYTLDKAENLDVLLESTQVYIQVYNYNKKMMDSHHAFMTPFLTHRLHDARELLQSTTCSCVERMIFCGFKKETTGSNIVIRGGDGFDYRIFKGIVQDDARVQNLARIRLRERTILGNPFVQEDIANFRRAFLQGKGIKDSYDEWKIVGLAQRSGRRRWLNIEETMTMCNKMLNSRIVCMIVNVEEAHFHPTMHVIVHASLDALIGIHGAQMTDAIWMRPGTFVGEFLPYLPQGVRYGDWTQEVSLDHPNLCTATASSSLLAF